MLSWIPCRSSRVGRAGAGIAVRHPDIVAAGRHYGTTVHTCVPFDPLSKGGAEATVRIAKAEEADYPTGGAAFTHGGPSGDIAV